MTRGTAQGIAPIRTVLLLGGTPPLLAFHDRVAAMGGVEIVFISSKRHLDAPVDRSTTLRRALAERSSRVVETDTFDVPVLEALGIPADATIAFSIAAPWIIRRDVLDALSGRVYNMHGARLPQDRGGATTSWQIMRGNRYGFALIHRVDEGVDTGDIVAFHEFLYDDCQVPADFQARYERELLSLLGRVVPALLRGEEPPRIAQPPYLSSYWPRLNTQQHGWIDWSWSGVDILRFIQAFDRPYAGARTYLNDGIVHLRDCAFDTSDGAFHPFQAGLIYRVSESYAAVCTSTGTLIVREVTGDGGPPLELARLRVGDRLFTPAARLEEARRQRVQYTPSGLKER